MGLVWSPDGTQVAYVEMLDSDFPEGGDLFVVDVASGTAEKVRHFAGPYVTALEWSPDGGRSFSGSTGPARAAGWWWTRSTCRPAS